MHMLKVPAAQGLQLLVIMTEVKFLKPYKILLKKVSQNTVNTATAVKYKKDLTYFICLQVKELERVRN